MYIVIVGNEIVCWEKTFKKARRIAVDFETLNPRVPVWIAKAIVKDGNVIDK